MTPLWSAAVDPRVLTARVIEPQEHVRMLDVESLAPRTAIDARGEHIAFNRNGRLFRLDVLEGTTLAGAVALRFEILPDFRLKTKLTAIEALYERVHPVNKRNRLATALLALQALDARETGKSLRQIADALLGPDDWPGEGEFRKSRIRRLVDTGQRLVRAGPLSVFERWSVPPVN